MRTKTKPEISFDDVGDTEPALLMLPGWCGPRDAFRPLLPHVRHRALAVDWRGHGGSDPATGEFGTAELVEDALAVIEAAGVGRVVPAATAHAGWIAIELRRRLGPARVPGVALIDWMVLGAPPPFVDGLRALQRPEAWEAMRARLFAMWTEGVAEQAVHDFIARMATFGFDMWARAGREIAAAFAACPVPLSALEPLGCPTVHIYAQPADPGFLAAQQLYAATHPWFTVEKLVAASHFPSLEVPRELAIALDGFADRLG